MAYSETTNKEVNMACLECAFCGWQGNGPCPIHGKGHMIWDEGNTPQNEWAMDNIDDDEENEEEEVGS